MHSVITVINDNLWLGMKTIHKAHNLKFYMLPTTIVLQVNAILHNRYLCVRVKLYKFIPIIIITQLLLKTNV